MIMQQIFTFPHFYCNDFLTLMMLSLTMELTEQIFFLEANKKKYFTRQWQTTDSIITYVKNPYYSNKLFLKTLTISEMKMTPFLVTF